jgi:diguanylate cyclase (GGDEF)-like protein/PAS domain S-box-containing protein
LRIDKENYKSIELLEKKIIDTLPDLIWLKDIDGVYLACNPEFELFFGAEESEIIGKTDYDFVDKDLADFFRKHDKLAMEADTPTVNEEWITYAVGGKRVLLQTTKTPLKDNDGTLVGILGIAHDITELENTKRELEKSVVLLEAIFETTNNGILVTDCNKRVLHYNRRFLELWNIHKSLHNERDDEKLLDSVLSQLVDPNAFIEKVNQLYNDSLAETVDEIIFKDGRIFERYSRPMSINGEYHGRVWSFLDTTRRKKAENRSEQQRVYTQALLDNFPFLVWLKDKKSNFLAVNRPFAEATGLNEPDLLIGKSDLDVWPEDLAETYRKDDAEVMKSLVKKDIEEEVCNEGERKWFETYKAPVIDSDGKLFGTVGFARDISDKKDSEEKLKLSASVFTYAHEGIMITDSNGVIVDVNDALLEITGYKRDEVVGKNPKMFKSGKSSKSFYKTMWQRIESAGFWRGEIENRKKGGDLYIELLTISAIYSQNGEVQNYVGIFSDITEQKLHQQKLEHIAHYDALTKLPNRVLFVDRITQAMAQTVRRKNLIAVAFIDLDGFKAVNDTYGHHIGDRLLVEVAEKMNHTVRKGDTVARLGGDEFVALLIDLPGKDVLYNFLNRLLQLFSNITHIDDLPISISASIGVTFYPQGEELSPDQIIRQADQAMYGAKLAGKNRYSIFDAENDYKLRNRNEILDRIESGIKSDEFVLYYQPKVNIRTGQVLGVEALIRWNHPEDGVLPPAKFLGVIENHPLAISLDEWVLRTALKQLLLWQKSGKNLSISVNISAGKLQQKDFVHYLASLLSEFSEVDPTLLTIEILETSALDDFEHVNRVIEEATDLGVSFSLDDFGTGYSSLTYLKRLSVNELKIDKSFVFDILNNPNDLAILDGTLGLANAFGRKAIAEGVEFIEHGIMLLELGCEIGQGYSIAKPMPVEKFEEWLKSWKLPKEWREREPIDKIKIPLLFAMVEHRAWLKEVEKYLIYDVQFPKYFSVEVCKFGKWLNGAGKDVLETEENFKAVDSIHNRLHQIAYDLVQQKEREGRNVREEEYEPLREQSEKLLSFLKNIIN